MSESDAVEQEPPQEEEPEQEPEPEQPPQEEEPQPSSSTLTAEEYAFPNQGKHLHPGQCSFPQFPPTAPLPFTVT